MEVPGKQDCMVWDLMATGQTAFHIGKFLNLCLLVLNSVVSFHTLLVKVFQCSVVSKYEVFDNGHGHGLTNTASKIPSVVRTPVQPCCLCHASSWSWGGNNLSELVQRSEPSFLPCNCGGMEMLIRGGYCYYFFHQRAKVGLSTCCDQISLSYCSVWPV